MKIDCVEHKVHHRLVDFGRVAQQGWQGGGGLVLDAHSLLFRMAAGNVERGFDARVQVRFLTLATVKPGKVTKVLNDLLDPLQAVARAEKVSSKLAMV